MKKLCLYFFSVLVSQILFAQNDTTPTPQWRPLYHFTPAKNWTNDPNGLLYLNGKYQLYNQQNPFENFWGHMSWGHATSTDLIEKNPDLVLRFTIAVMKGARYLKANREGTIKVLQKYAKNVPVEHISESMDETQPTVLADGQAALELRQLDLGLRGTMLGIADAQRPALDKVYDYSFIQKAVAELAAKGWKPGD